MTEPETGIYGGVDTHRDVHVAAVVDQTGRIRDVASFPRRWPATANCSPGCAATAN